jgi:hypothetical protein
VEGCAIALYLVGAAAMAARALPSLLLPCGRRLPTRRTRPAAARYMAARQHQWPGAAMRARR